MQEFFAVRVFFFFAMSREQQLKAGQADQSRILWDEALNRDKLNVG